MKTLMKKKKNMKLLMTALVGAVALYGCAMLYSVSAMKSANSQLPIQQEETVYEARCPKCEEVKIFTYIPGCAMIFPKCPKCEKNMTSMHNLFQQVKVIDWAKCPKCENVEMFTYIRGCTISVPHCSKCGKTAIYPY